MAEKTNKFIIPLLSIALIAICGWGYTQYQGKRQWEINAENQYQRAFEELTAHASNMETQMTKAMVTNSFEQTINYLTNIWRESNACQEDLGQLPLTSVELARTKLLLAKAGTFCFNTAQQKLARGARPSEAEWRTLRQLRDQTRLVTRSLLGLRDHFYNNRARWLEVDRFGTLGAAGLARDTLNNNQVTKAFIMLEDGLRRIPEVDFAGSNLDFVPKATGLTGANISSRDAVQICRNILGPEWRNADFRYDRVIRGGFPSYMISAVDRRNRGRSSQISVSVKGGHLAWLLSNRNVTASRLNLDQGQERALEFLNRTGYPAMEAVGRESYGNVATYTCVPVRNQALYYPEMVKVQVARDNGEILGCDAIPYLTFFNPDGPGAGRPRFNEARARQLISPRLVPERIRLAQVLDEMYNKVLCYEVSGRQGDDYFKVYYNADTGKEEKIRRVDRNGNEIL